ncbi:MAG UNVERIFIED_CONTAM: hypothetical protein LVQ98_04420 [Rickettsiaceae bacterium]
MYEIFLPFIKNIVTLAGDPLITYEMFKDIVQKLAPIFPLQGQFKLLVPKDDRFFKVENNETTEEKFAYLLEIVPSAKWISDPLLFLKSWIMWLWCS